MKKILAYFLFLSLALMLGGCDLFSKDDNTIDNGSTTENQTTKQDQTSNTTNSTTDNTTTNNTTTEEVTTDSTTTNNTTTEDKSNVDVFGNVYFEEVDSNYQGDYITSSVLSIDEMKNQVLELSSLQGSVTNGIYKESYQKGLLSLFNLQNKVSIAINISKSELKKIEDDNYTQNAPTKDIYRICDLDITYLDLTFHFEEVGIRMKGNTSRGAIFDGDNINLRHYKLAFAETFDGTEYGSEAKVWESKDIRKVRKNRTFFGLEKLDIRYNKNQESTYLREYYAYEMYRSFGLLAPHSNPMQVTMNVDNTSYSCGLYLGLETIDKALLARNLLSQYATGDLYKCGYGSGRGADLNSTDDYLFGVEDAATGQFYTYDLKTNKKTSNHSTIKNFIQALGSTSDIEGFIRDNVYEDEFFKYLALGYFLGDPDDFRGNMNNYYIYFEPTTNKMIMIPTDHDRVLGSMGGSNPTGSASTLVKPFDKVTGYCGDTNQNLLYKTIYDNANAYCIAQYKLALENVANSEYMKLTKYEECFNLVKKHYEGITIVSSNVSSKMPTLSLEEDNDPSSAYNLSIGVYLEKKLETYNGNKDGTSSEESGDIVVKDVYIRGTMNSWNIDSSYKMTYNEETKKYEFTISASIDAEIKVYVVENIWYGYESLGASYDFVTDADNIKFTKEGNYKIIYDDVNKTILIEAL